MTEMVDKCEAIAAMAARDNLARVNELSASVNPKKSIYLGFIKRLIDLAISVPAFVVLLPVNLVIGVITYLDVGKPIFFVQKRIGKDGRIFNLVKFRNMTNATDEFGNLLPPSERVIFTG